MSREEDYAAAIVNTISVLTMEEQARIRGAVVALAGYPQDLVENLLSLHTAWPAVMEASMTTRIRQLQAECAGWGTPDLDVLGWHLNQAAICAEKLEDQ